MPETLFRPQLDGGFPKNTLKLYQVEMSSFRFLCRKCMVDVVKELQKCFSESIENEDLRDELNDWVRAASDDFLPRVADSIVMLDYFLTRSVVPDICGEREREYWLERLKVTMQKNMARSLTWKVVLDLIPGSHHIHTILARQVEDEVNRLGVFEEVQIEIDLKIPVDVDPNLPGKGGASWLRGQTLHEWKKIKSQIDSGKPCLIELIRESSDRNACELNVVVGYRYENTTDQCATIDVFDSRFPEHTTKISVNFQSEQLEGTAMPSQSDDLPIRGILVWEYSRKLPPIRGWVAWISRFLVPAFWWRRQRKKAMHRQ